MTLLFVGALVANVVDLEHRRSKTLRFVVGQLERGTHICIVDDYGLTSLLAGRAPDGAICGEVVVDDM